jgi:hypothetical protein
MRSTYALLIALALTACPTHEERAWQAAGHNIAARANALLAAEAGGGRKFAPPRTLAFDDQAGELVAMKQLLPVFRLANGELAIGSYGVCAGPQLEYVFFRHAQRVRVVVIYPAEQTRGLARCGRQPRLLFRLGMDSLHQVEVEWETYDFAEIPWFAAL